MPVPEKERIHALFGKLVEVAGPRGLVIEPGKVLRGVGVVVLGALVGDLGLLQADDGTANFQLRMIFEVELAGKCVGGVNAVDELFGSIEDTGWVIPGDDDGVADARE